MSEQRQPDTAPNEERGKELGGKLVEQYWKYDHSVKEVSAKTRGQLQLLFTDMLLTLTPGDFQEAGFRMAPDEENLCDMTAMADIVGGQFVFAQYGSMKDYQFFMSVIAGVRERFESASTEETPLIDVATVWDKVKLPDNA